MLEIVQYLSLNDAVNAFSDNILLLLQEYHTRVHLSQSNPAFVDRVLQTLNPEQIASFRIDTIHTKIDRYLSTTLKLTNIVSLTLFNSTDVLEINQNISQFPHLLCLSLSYDREVDFIIMASVFRQLCKPLKRLEIHGIGAFCMHFYEYLLISSAASNAHVKSLLIEVGHLLLPSRNQCRQEYQFCFLTTIKDLLSAMGSIRHVRLITDKHNLDQVLDWNQWTTLINKCSQLKTITVETWRYTSSGEQYVEKAMEIRTTSHRTKKTLS